MPLKLPLLQEEVMCVFIANIANVRVDTDSTAAMTGALSGAYLGLQQLPSNWIHHICDKDEWHLKDFVHLGQQCYDIKFPPQNNP